MSKNSLLAWFLITSVFFSVFLAPTPATQAQTDPLYIVYINDQAGLSLVTQSAGGWSAPQTFVTAIDLPVYSLYASPDGQKIGVMYAQPYADGSPVVLKVYSIPTGTLLFEQNLLPANMPIFSESDLGNPLYEMTRAVTTALWSPDGQKLAFVSGHDGISANLYLVDFTSVPTPTALESHSGAAAFPSWSPDGNWLVYSDLETFGGAGYVSQGIYAIHLADAQVVTLDDGTLYPTDVTRVGWRGTDTLLFAPPSYTAGAHGLYGWNLSNAATTAFLPDAAENTLPVYDPISDIAAFVVPQQAGNLVFEPGVYTIALASNTPIQITTGDWYDVRLIGTPYFQAVGASGEMLINGQTFQQNSLPVGALGTFITPNLSGVVVYFNDGIQLSALDGSNPAKLPIEGALPPTWSPDGQWFITYGFTNAGAGLLSVDISTQVATLLDTTAAIGGLWTLVFDTTP
ncbi:MAG: PD40 domain-containing protein [Chloroflexi bacterium]|nr:PD40 domain-containing protein [Chloroflexota bacterium]